MMEKQPNILYLILDQLAPQILGAYDCEVCQTPTINEFAGQRIVFENGYRNYPICAPARYAFMSGRLPSRMGVLDNASEFPSKQPTFAHYLSRLCLGKVLNTGKRTPWYWQLGRDASIQYFRSAEDGQQALQHGTLDH